MTLFFAFDNGNSPFQRPWFELFQPERARLIHQLLLGLGVMPQLKIFRLGSSTNATATTQCRSVAGRNNNPTTICSRQQVYIESLGLPYYALAAWQCLLWCRELCILALASASFCADNGSSNNNNNNNNNNKSTVDTMINSKTTQH
eukprot:jgi/Psemu1/14453/gm1.14453_g